MSLLQGGKNIDKQQFTHNTHLQAFYTHLTCMFLNFGQVEESRADTRRTCKLHTEKAQAIVDLKSCVSV